MCVSRATVPTKCSLNNVHHLTPNGPFYTITPSQVRRACGADLSGVPS